MALTAPVKHYSGEDKRRMNTKKDAFGFTYIETPEGGRRYPNQTIEFGDNRGVFNKAITGNLLEEWYDTYQEAEARLMQVPPEMRYHQGGVTIQGSKPIKACRCERLPDGWNYKLLFFVDALLTSQETEQ